MAGDEIKRATVASDAVPPQQLWPRRKTVNEKISDDHFDTSPARPVWSSV
jgi:hypothetical protein